MLKFFQFFVSLYVWIAAGSAFLFSLIFGIIAFKIFPPQKVHTIYKYMLRLVFILSFVRVKRVNVPKADKNTTYFYLGNHTSIADVPLMGAYLPTLAVAVEAESHFSWPIYKHLIKNFGQIPINRENPRASYRSMQEALKKLQSGTSIILFPEGHRTRVGRIQEFKKLPFVIALKSGVPIVPFSVSGMWTLSPNDKFKKRPTKIILKFADPVMPEEYANMTAEELRDKVFEIVKNGIEYY